MESVLKSLTLNSSSSKKYSGLSLAAIYHKVAAFSISHYNLSIFTLFKNRLLTVVNK